MSDLDIRDVYQSNQFDAANALVLNWISLYRSSIFYISTFNSFL